MGFTNALFLNTQKQKGKKKVTFWQIISKSTFPNSKPQPKQMGYFRKTIPKPFYIKTVEFWEFGNPNKP